MNGSIIYKSKLIMGYMTLSRVLIIPCEIFLRAHLITTRIIYLLGSSRSIVDGLGDAL